MDKCSSSQCVPEVCGGSFITGIIFLHPIRIPHPMSGAPTSDLSDEEGNN